MQNARKPFTVKRGRHGWNGDDLAAMTLKEAQAKFENIDRRLIKEAHTEAVKRKKENEKAAKSKK